MDTGSERSQSLEDAERRFNQFVEANCTMFGSLEERPTPDQLGMRKYRLSNLPGTPLQNVLVTFSVSLFEGDEGEVVHHSIAYATNEGAEILSLSHEPSENGRPFWVSNSGDIDSYDVTPHAISEMLGMITYWLNSGALVPEAENAQ